MSTAKTETRTGTLTITVEEKVVVLTLSEKEAQVLLAVIGNQTGESVDKAIASNHLLQGNTYTEKEKDGASFDLYEALRKSLDL